jgi:hypothetical protein
MVAMSPWFAAQWERGRVRREIAELEELARVLPALWGTSAAIVQPRVIIADHAAQPAT